MDQIRAQFPLLANQPDLAYFDSAATTLKPQVVLSAMDQYYQTVGANVHRGLYDLSERATMMYEDSRKAVANFIKAKPEEIIFTSGTTASLNLAARLLEQKLQPSDEIVLTRFEHHANLIPWQQVAQRTGAILKFIELDADYHLDWNSANSMIGSKTKIVAFSAASNVLGTIVNVNELVRLAKKVGAYTVVDAAQLVAHKEIHVNEWDVDFLAFSGHKVYGPTGIGVLYGKSELLTELEPVNFGGEMIREVTYEAATWADAPQKFEAGTPPIAEAIGLAAAITFIESIGWDAIFAHNFELINYVLTKLNPVVKIIGPFGDKRVPVFSFTLGDAHPHDVAEILNRSNIAVRAGHHCAMPLMKHLGLVGTTRASFGLYTTKNDIDALVSALQEAKQILKVWVRLLTQFTKNIFWTCTATL